MLLKTAHESLTALRCCTEAQPAHAVSMIIATHRHPHRCAGRREDAYNEPCLIRCLPAAGAVSTASIQPGTPVGSVPQSAVTTENIAIATAAEAAVAAGRPARWLVSFRVPEQQIEVQASAVATAAGPELPVRQAATIARQQVYAAVKSSVLKAAAAPTSATATSTDAIVTEAGSAQAQPSLAVVTDYSHMPITLVSISDAAELARLRANPYVASVSADGVVRTMAMNGLELIGQPAAEQLGYIGAGSVVIVDTGEHAHSRGSIHKFTLWIPVSPYGDMANSSLLALATPAAGSSKGPWVCAMEL